VQSTPRIVVDPLAVPRADDPEIASAACPLQPPPSLVVAPSVHLRIEVLRQPVDFAQYTSIRYTERLGEAGAVASVGSRGDSYDNAMAESTIGLYKAELIHARRPWRNIEHVEFATLAWVDWWNNRRLHSEIGDVPPAELEANYYRQTSAA